MNDLGLTVARTGEAKAVATVTSCLVTCVKNEGRYLLEWIAYHKVLGFDEIAVYDNQSSDGTFALLAPLAERGEIYLERVTDSDKISPQIDAYEREMRRASAAEWVMFIDADEFVVLREPITFNEFLASFPFEVSQICINWRVFGSSGKVERTDELVIERFLRASSSTAKPNAQGKSVARRARIVRPWIHASHVNGPTVHDDGSVAEMPKCLGITLRISHVRAAVHHYILKSRAEFNAKLDRGIASEPLGSPRKYRQDRDWYWEVHDLNEEFNDEALSRVAAVRTEVARLTAIAGKPSMGETAAIAPSVNPSLGVAIVARVAAMERRLDLMADQESKRAAKLEQALNARTAQLEVSEKRHQKNLQRLRTQIKHLKAAGRRRKRWRFLRIGK